VFWFGLVETWLVVEEEALDEITILSFSKKKGKRKQE
jgi:hypothetical protein